ncbi:MAG: GldG family protein [Phycisphaerales bacterium]|nr:GldG family protein [Phycisphaerales bacterium]
MTSTHTQHTREDTSAGMNKTAFARRLRYVFQTLALLLAVSAVCVLAIVISDRFPHRLDATSTREHQLSDRTRQLLQSLSGDYEVVVAANFSTIEPAHSRRTQDVLDNFVRSSPRVRTTIIDVASGDGLTKLDALLARLADRFKNELSAQNSGLTAARDRAVGVATDLSALSQRLLDALPSTPATDKDEPLRRFLRDSAAVCRVSAEEITKALDAITSAPSPSPARAQDLSADERLAQLRRPLSDVLAQIGKIGDNLEAVARSGDTAIVPADVRVKSGNAAQLATSIRRNLGEMLAMLDDLPRSPVGAVARLLERTSAAVVIGPPGAARGGVTSIDLSSIYPTRFVPPSGVSAPAPASATIDLRSRTEELLAGAIASLAKTDAPIVVFVHGRNVRMAPEFAPVAAVVDRLRLRGIDSAEWAAGLDADPPTLANLNPKGDRPIVHVLISMAPGNADDATRFSKLAAAGKLLIDQGRHVLVCAVPSTLPGTGQRDPMVEFLSPLGVSVDTGRPLLRQTQTPRGRVVSPDLFITEPLGDHAISQAVRGLTVYLPWALPVRTSSTSPVGVTITPMIVTDNAGGSIWAEAEFIGFLQTPSAQQPLLINPPSPGNALDDSSGPWTLAAGIERTVGSTPQRVIVVGCNRWMAGDVIGAEASVEGRSVPAYPGNMELLEASIGWLGGQDGAITRSAQAQAVARIPPLSSETLTALRWSLIGGLPLLILLFGAIWRVVRG